MENYENEKRNKLGAGIITLAVIQFVTNGFGIVSCLMLFLGEDFYQSLGIPVPDTGLIIFNFVYIILVVVSLILILLKNKIGIYIYFTMTAINIICSIVFYGFSILTLVLSLVLPVLTAIFIYKKKHLYFK